MTKNVYTELWDAKNYTCDWTKMTVNRLKAGDLLPTSFKAGTLTIIPAGTYSTDVPINFESCAAALGIGNVVVNSSSLEAGFNIGTNNVTIQNISFVGK